MSHNKAIGLAVFLVLGAMAGTAVSMYWGFTDRISSHRRATKGTDDFTCPMNPETHSFHPGNCPQDEIDLVKVTNPQSADSVDIETAHRCCPQPVLSTPARQKPEECPYPSSVNTPAITETALAGCPMHSLQFSTNSAVMINQNPVFTHLVSP